jgi:hypothetical protein
VEFYIHVQFVCGKLIQASFVPAGLKPRRHARITGLVAGGDRDAAGLPGMRSILITRRVRASGAMEGRADTLYVINNIEQRSARPLPSEPKIVFRRRASLMRRIAGADMKKGNVSRDASGRARR